MALRDSYKHLLGLSYKSGQHDCYGLALRYYKEIYNVTLVNAARPENWWHEPDMDLINEFADLDGWEKIGINIRALKIGDGLVFSLITGRANHVGIYVGNGMFIHHVLNRFSTEDPLTDKWKSKLLMIIRHPEVAKIQEMSKPPGNHFPNTAEVFNARVIRPPST